MRGIALTFAALLAVFQGPDTRDGEPLGPSVVAEVYGYSAVGLPWHNPCGELAPIPWILVEAYHDEDFEKREKEINDRAQAWSYAVRIPLDVRSAPDCAKAFSVEYYIVSGFRPNYSPAFVAHELVGAMFVGTFLYPMRIDRAEPVGRLVGEGEVIAPEVVFYVPRGHQEVLTVYHQAAALVYDITGTLRMVLTSHAITVVAMPGEVPN